MIYNPGIAYLAKEVGTKKELTYDYTAKWDNVAIVCDGTRVLGLGDIGILDTTGKSVLLSLIRY